MQNNQTRKLAHGAMMIAIFTVLMAIVFYIPMANIIAAIIAPLPMIWYSANYDRRSSFLIAIIAVIVTFFIGGLLLIPASLIFAAAGVAIGDAIYNKKSKVFMFISTSIVLLVTFAIQYVISLRLFEVDFIRDSMELMKTSYIESIKMTEKLTGQATPKEVMDNMNNMLNTLEMTLPASITLAMLFVSFIIITVNLPILKRLKVDVPKFAKFSELRLPRSVLWYYLIALSINLFVQPEPNSSLAIIMLNVSMILWILLTLQGISFIHFAIDAFGYPKFIKVLSTIVAIPLYSFVILIGIIDLGFNARDYIREKSQK
ncbi:MULTISPECIES: YybS family protein [Solibacillus]|uniref:YybS family protein n=1 Tax=Solibacillus merdavium TaxID=2762218 RepID=A0ABR8XP19_9BACL|nr:YybS family protein [Solibacillus merdavium]MBD8033639.1 YybS family protein [Solibacillus merdavium]